MSGWSSFKEGKEVVRSSIAQVSDPSLSRNPKDYNMAGVYRDFLTPGWGGGCRPVQHDEEFFHQVLRNNARKNAR